MERQVKSIEEVLEKQNLANAASLNYRLKWRIMINGICRGSSIIE